MSKLSNIIKKTSLIPTVLIYGGSNYIGYHLAKSFLLKEARVVYIDTSKNIENSKIKEFIHNKNFALFKQDVFDELPKEIQSVDYAIYIGELESCYTNYKDIDLSNLLLNSNSLKNVLDLVSYSGAKFLFFSPILSIYNDVKISKNTYDFIQLYKFSESLILEYSKNNSCDSRIIRVPYVYGPDISFHSSGAVGSFIDNLLKNTSLHIYGDESRYENYVYIEDLVSASIRALFSPVSNENIFNLIQDDSHKVLSTCYLFKNLSNRITDIRFKDSSIDYINFNFIENNNNLDWIQKYSLKEGIIKTLDYYGYKCSNNSFKPNDLILEKNKEANSESILYSNNKNEDTKIVTSSINKIQYKSKINIFSKIKNIYNKLFLSISLNKNKRNEKKEVINLKVTNSKKSFNLSSLINQKSIVFITVVAILASWFMVFVFLPLFSFNVSIKNTHKHLTNAKESISSFNFTQSRESIDLSMIELNKIRSPLFKSKWLFTLYLKEDGYKSLVSFINSLSHFVKSANYVLLAAEPFENALEILHPDSNNYYDENSTSNSISYLFTAKKEINLAKSNFEYVNKDSLPKFTHKYLNTYSDYLNSYTTKIDELSVALSDLDSLLAIDDIKHYIIWFQNSNELRPTGGFIGSYGLLTLDKGKIIGLTIDDIYNPDGQIDLLDIKTPIPSVLANNLAEDRLYLRNSNWNIDFTVSARNFSDLYYRTTGTKIDGVIAIDLYFVKNILDNIGPIYLASYDEQISADNLYERTQFYSDFDYSKGVSEKKNFLTSLSSKLTETIFSLSATESEFLYNSIIESLKQKHLLLHVHNNSINTFLEKENYNGSFVSTNGDYLYINNANIGGTKANYFVKNNYEYLVQSKTRDGLLRSELNLTYQHTGLDSSWPGGPYKNYIRVVKNNGTKLIGAELSINDSEYVDIFEEISIENENNKNITYFSYLLNIEPQDTAIIKLKFDLPEKLSLTKSLMDYKLYWQKQPGTKDDSISFIFDKPFGSEITNINTNFDNNEYTKYSDLLNYDKYIEFELR